MKEYVIPKKMVVQVCALWWAIFVVCAGNGWNPLGLLWIIGIPFTLLLPGVLTLLLVHSVREPLPMRLATAVALSVFELIFLGLVGNAVLPTLGVDRPLDTTYALWLISTLLLVLLVLAWGRISDLGVVVPRIATNVVVRHVLFTLIPIVFVGMGVAGALVLNRYDQAWVTMTMLAAIALYVIAYMRQAQKLAPFVAPTALFCIALALLYMTSLRGEFITGHDIQREYFVFQLAKDAGLWSVEVYRDAYNACLSITVLPTLLANVLHIPDIYIYKALLQGVFATSVVGAFYIARRLLAVPFAFLATVILVSFPTFFQDMPFLVRQEVAFLFLVLMTYFLFNERYTLRARRTLFIIFGTGVLFAHYSTMYMVLAVFLMTAIATPLAQRLWGRVRTMHNMRESALYDSHEGGDRRGAVTLGMVGALVVLTIVWTSAITGTDRHVREVASTVWSSMFDGFDGNEHSIDVFSVFSFGRVEAVATIEEYVEQVVKVRRTESPDEFYPDESFSNFPLVSVERTELPVTALGALALPGGVSVNRIVTVFGQLIAKIVQVAILVGIVYVCVRKTLIRRVSIEYVVLAASSLVFIALCIVIPVLSKEYGLFRALQQSLFVLAPFVLVGVFVVSDWVVAGANKGARAARAWSKPVSGDAAAYFSASALCVIFFLYTTGVMTQLVGGNVPALHLNNVGDDYKQYVTERSEYEAIQWLRDRLEEDHERTGKYPLVQSDRFGEKKLQAYISSRVGGDIYPGAIHKDAYVFIPPAVLYGGVATVPFDGSTLKFAYSMDFLEHNKELVYDRDGVRIYR
ncbi:MAG: DUF2206 domain-containing protein [Candidatus Pacebacteria bacterium]|nr:DUF2206 domain-containing protein [Candidatus Paceibacterota bacterium]